jgi:predicted ATPase
MSRSYCRLAVLGREFTLAMVRRTVARSEDDLERTLAGLQMAEFIYQQPSFPERQYIFKHALTQEVAYGSLLIERRKLLHERAAAAMEELYADRLSDHVIQLAHHYRHSGKIAKAVEYLHRAGEQTLAHLPNQEAINSLTEALELLMTIPDDPDRAQRELPIQLAIAGAWRAWKAWHGP